MVRPRLALLFFRPFFCFCVLACLRRLSLTLWVILLVSAFPLTSWVTFARSLAGKTPIIQPCTTVGQWHSGIIQRQITLSFDETLLGDDAVRVWPTVPDTEGLVSLAMYNCVNGTCLSSCKTNVTCVNNCARINSAMCRQGWVSPHAIRRVPVIDESISDILLVIHTWRHFCL